MSANILASGPGPVPENAGSTDTSVKSWRVIVARVLNLVQAGKIGAVTTVTLTASATSTTLTDDRIGPNSWIGLSPLTANATILDLAPWISARGVGTATITHGSSPAVDLTFGVVILG